MRKETALAKSKGFNPIDDIAKNDNFVPNITKEGTIRSELASDNVNKFIEPYAKQVSQHIQDSNIKVDLEDFKKSVLSDIEEYKLTGSDYTKMVKRIERDFKVYEEFIDKTGQIPL